MRKGSPSRPVAYFPFTQASGISEMQCELHTPGDPKMLIAEAARLVHQTNPDLPLRKPATQQAQFTETVAEERLLASLSVFFAGLAAFLIAIGLYGTMSYSIARRTMEIGVRMALGAQRREVLRMVLSESAAVAAAGLAIGVPASLAVARTLRSMLYGLGSGDPLSLVVAVAGIAAVALAAAILPARRAASADPFEPCGWSAWRAGNFARSRLVTGTFDDAQSGGSGFQWSVPGYTRRPFTGMSRSPRLTRFRRSRRLD